MSCLQRSPSPWAGAAIAASWIGGSERCGGMTMTSQPEIGLKWVGISSFPDESDNGDGNAPGSYRGNVRRVDSTRSSNALTALVASMGMSRTRMLRTTIRLQVSPSCVAIV